VGNENYFVRCVKQKFIYDIICCAAWIAQCLVLYFIRFEWHFYSPITENTICPFRSLLMLEVTHGSIWSKVIGNVPNVNGR
jgi:hypothetical protein